MQIGKIMESERLLEVLKIVRKYQEDDLKLLEILKVAKEDLSQEELEVVKFFVLDVFSQLNFILE